MHRSLVLALLLPAACTTTPAPVDDGAELYEDVLDPGKADGHALDAPHEVDGYEAIREPRLVTEDLELEARPGSFTARRADRLLLIRQLDLDGVASYVAIDVDRHRVGVAAAAAVEARTRPATAAELAGAAYLTALDEKRDATYTTLRPVADGGSAIRFTVTIDMCQSSRAWERGLYDWLVARADETGAPTPVGVAMTGLWARTHPRELRQLLAWQDEGKLDITWINHSDRHELGRDAAGIFHFLTAPGVDFHDDVLDLEVTLLGQGVLFSPLFRFPGLTHDRARRAELNDLGLVALDADGWIAKGEPIHDGAVVLLHGNGNERIGVEMFFEQIDELDGELLELVSPVEVLPAPSR